MLTSSKKVDAAWKVSAVCLPSSAIIHILRDIDAMRYAAKRIPK
jgi:hypothetical protein